MSSRRICVFCGSHLGRDERFVGAAIDAAERIVRAGYGVVYGGGRVGLMGVVANAALAAGGEVIGVIPGALASAEVAHQGLSALHVVQSMHERKAMMTDLSEAFIALPGGFGTMDELCEALTWRQLKIHDKPVGIFNFEGFFDPLLSLFDRMVDEGFVMERSRALLRASSSIDELLSWLDGPRNGNLPSS